MFESLVITLREGVEAALVLAIATAVLERRQLQALRPALFAGAGVALVASVVAVALTLRVTYDQELVEGIVMLVGAVLVATLVWWMWKAAPHLKQEIESAIDRASSKGAGGASALGLFLFAFGMVFREGAETAVFLSASAFNSQGLGLWIGAIVGLGLAAAFGVLFVRGVLKIPLGPFFSITSAVLILIAVQLLIGGLHELSEAQVLPSSKAEMALIGPLVKNELLLFTLTVAFAAGWILFGPRRPTAGAPVPPPAPGPRARLERAARASESRRLRWTGTVAMLIVGLLATAFVQGSHVPEPAPAQPIALENGVGRLDAAPCRDGRMHFYEAALPEGAVRFFVIQVGEELRTCFDACEICGDMGYFEDGDAVVCRNCVSPIVRTSLGRSGGCNPIPLPHRLEGDQLVIQQSDLSAVVPHLKGR